MIFWKEEVWNKVRYNDSKEKGKVVEGIGAIIELSNLLIGIIDIV